MILLGGLTSCRVDVPRDPRVLTMHLSAEPDTLNPITSTDVYASQINNYLFDNLVKRNNETLAFEPQLAERWTVSGDKRTFTFYLRPGINWHDGTALTVDDIIYSFERIMDPKVAAPNLRGYYQQIESVRKVKSGVVEFQFKQPYFMALNFAGGIPIVPKHLYEHEENFNQAAQGRAPIGNGPYRFVSWKTGRGISLARNPDYWGKLPAIEFIEYKIVGEAAIALQALKKGLLDMAGLRPIQWVRQTDSKKFNQRFKKYKYYTPGYSFIGWNMKRPYFNDPQVRRALTQLLDRKSILKTLSFNLGKVVTGPFYTEGLDYNRKVSPWPYNPTEAKRLLTGAGWQDSDGDGVRERDGVKFAFEFLIPSGRRFTEQLATILKEDFRRAGIEVTIRKLEWALFTQKLGDRSFDAVSLGWSFGFEQDPYQVWHGSQAKQGSNFVGYQDADSDRWIEAGRTTYDPKQRAALNHKLHQRIHELQPYTFLFASPALVAVDRRFENVKVYPVGLDPKEWRLAPVMEGAP